MRQKERKTKGKKDRKTKRKKEKERKVVPHKEKKIHIKYPEYGMLLYRTDCVIVCSAV